jgi:predicted dehydrogenase
MKKYRAAVIGCGHRAGAHIEAYRHIPNAEVVACCAPSALRRDPMAAKYGLRAYADPAEMIRAEQPDIVHLVTWPDTRVALMTLVAELQVPLCTTEKPLATGMTDWRALCALEDGTKTRFAVCHQLRWQPNLLRCRQVLQSGRLGKVLFLDLSAGMNIAGQGTHTLNYGMALNADSPVTRVFASASGWDTSDPGHPGPLATEAYLSFDNGARGLWVSGSPAPHCGDPSTVWQHVRVAAYAERGRVLFEEFGRWQTAGEGTDASGGFGGMEKWAENNLLAQAGFHQAMFDWLEDQRRVPGTHLKQSLHEWAVVLALYQSAITRAPIEMDGFDPPDDLVERYRFNSPLG